MCRQLGRIVLTAVRGPGSESRDGVGGWGVAVRVLRSGVVLADSWRMNRYYSSKEKGRKFQTRRYLVPKCGVRDLLRNLQKARRSQLSHGSVGQL